ncbi:hypothetical protein [Psychrobacter sp. DAB_AL32B]|uniref:hypothetical protein n=1 Tax=Psychrobacter sp. DAB_AL32B TaxID=1028414 RepID=UPI000B7D88C5|nr:hypothetical protein [Psychrobacter sp. DAB_AL32B]OXL25280.1 hypothetical protein CAN34_04575 [Psychrobacter sp. DAB_AL32B]
MKQNDEQSCCCKDLLPLMTKIVEQNSILIEQSANKEQVIMQLVEQIDGSLAELSENMQEYDEPGGSTFLDG